nr:ribonuclease H-like domain-containing protein [Tanacetum cinerariifolium]
MSLGKAVNVVVFELVYGHRGYIASCFGCRIYELATCYSDVRATEIYTPFCLPLHPTPLLYGSLSRYKPRLVANGRSQQQGIDCDETSSQVVKLANIHTVFSLAISRTWPLHQLDVKNAFLHAYLFETVYMHRPPGFHDLTHLDYAIEILERAHMPNYNPSKTPFTTESKLGLDGDLVKDPTLFHSLAVGICSIGKDGEKRKSGCEIMSVVEWASVGISNVSNIYWGMLMVKDHEVTKKAQENMHIIKQGNTYNRFRGFHFSPFRDCISSIIHIVYRAAVNSEGYGCLFELYFGGRVKELLAQDFADFADFAKSVSEEALEKMMYLQAALTETLRLFPTVPVISELGTISCRRRCCVTVAANKVHESSITAADSFI